MPGRTIAAAAGSGRPPGVPAVARARVVSPVPRPFLKWAGGKGQLLGELLPRALRGLTGGAYHEPFIGGGALLFELARTGRLPRHVTISDGNPNLIQAYVAVREDVEALIELLRDHKRKHDEAHYYEVRATVPESGTERAARIIYLNKTCYNGLYRENSRGGFNVPMGRYENPEIADEANLRAVSEVLSRVEITCGDFGEVEGRAAPGDLVYFDPPYDPVSRTASFTAYSRTPFGVDQQRRLAGLVRGLSRRRVKVLLSNSMTPLVRDLYEGLRVETVLASRSVNSKGDRRGRIEEALVSTYPFEEPVQEALFPGRAASVGGSGG